MTEAEQEKSPPNMHEVLSWQLTNMTGVQRSATNNALIEYANLVERCAQLKSENVALLAEVARLVQRVLELENARTAALNEAEEACQGYGAGADAARTAKGIASEIRALKPQRRTKTTKPRLRVKETA